MAVGSSSRPARRNRAALRREKRARPTPSVAPARAGLSPLPLVLVALWWVASAVLLGAVALWVGRRITWYLAVDQYGYLTFAHDLVRGRVFHHWPPLDALAQYLPKRVDVLSQTYIYDQGKLYCRYAPGFPIILAGWLLLFGDDGAHYLNPAVFVALLALLVAFQRRLFHSRWRALAGAALVVLFPTYIHLWATTLVRDLATHLVGILGLFLLLPVRGRALAPGRAAAAGLALGYAASIRPDAILYSVPALLVAARRWRREGADRRRILGCLGAGALALFVGLTPFLAYNWAATGSPFRPTQGMELQQFLNVEGPQPATPAEPVPRVGFPPGAWRGGTAEAVQGGGLKISNLPRILPGNLRLLRNAYGDVALGLAVWGAVLALAWRRTLFLATVPYVLLALLFYSCWSRPDARYLSGVYCLVPMLIVEGMFGTLDLVRRYGRGARRTDFRVLAVAVAALLGVAVAVGYAPRQQGALPVLVYLLPLGTAAAMLVAAVWPRRRVARVAAPVLALVLVGMSVWRAQASWTTRAAFQGPEMLRARTTFARAVGPRAVVITSEDVGRPAENIDYYSGVAHALYITDLMRWRMFFSTVFTAFQRAGMVPYLFIPPSQPLHDEMLKNLRLQFHVEQVADIEPRQAINYFVAAPFHRGIKMELYRVTPKSSARAARPGSAPAAGK